MWKASIFMFCAYPVIWTMFTYMEAGLARATFEGSIFLLVYSLLYIFMTEAKRNVP